jgi:GH25 family lysozyme M1 (1,4-beta-N-acetylmuramidase)
VDRELLASAMSMNRQTMAESAAQFTQDTNDGTQKEMTATEVMARVNSSNQLMGSMLVRAYRQQAVQYREICRRFATIDHPDCVKFRAKCEAQGVDPSIWENLDDWNVDPEKVMGAGTRHSKSPKPTAS